MNDNCLFGWTKNCLLISVCYKFYLKIFDNIWYWWYCNIIFHFDDINVTKKTDSGSPIVQSSTCLKNVLLNQKKKKKYSVESFINYLLNIVSNKQRKSKSLEANVLFLLQRLLYCHWLFLKINVWWKAK